MTGPAVCTGPHNVDTERDVVRLTVRRAGKGPVITPARAVSPEIGQDGAQPGQGRGVGVLGRAAVADHQPGPDVVVWAGRVGAVVSEPVEREAMLAGGRDNGVLQARSGQFEHRVQARGDPGDLQSQPAKGGAAGTAWPGGSAGRSRPR